MAVLTDVFFLRVPLRVLSECLACGGSNITGPDVTPRGIHHRRCAGAAVTQSRARLDRRNR
jgi:hypothetical protein